MLALTSTVQAARATTGVTSRLLSLCGSCQVLLLGERHRQPESPPLFLHLVTRLLRQGERILVGLEIPAARQGALDAVMAGARTPEGLAHPIIDAPAFQRLLLDLAALQRAYGALVTVAAIDDLGGGVARDAAMARRIRHHLTAGDVDRVVALVGNLHTIRKLQRAEDTGHKRPYLAAHLVSAGVRVVSVMQDLDTPCDRLRRPVFYSVQDRQGLEAVRRQLSVIKHHPDMDMRHASDGIVMWQCRASR